MDRIGAGDHHPQSGDVAAGAVVVQGDALDQDAVFAAVDEAGFEAVS